MQSSLRTFLSTVEGITVVGSTGAAEEAYKAARAQHIDLLLVDVDMVGVKPHNRELYKQSMNLVDTISPGTRCLVLVNDTQQQQLAIAGGVHGAFLKGELNEQLRSAIEDISRQINNERRN